MAKKAQPKKAVKKTVKKATTKEQYFIHSTNDGMGFLFDGWLFKEGEVPEKRFPLVRRMLKIPRYKALIATKKPKSD